MSCRYSLCFSLRAPEHLREQHLREADDGVERRPELVGHVGEELRLVAVGHLELGALVGDLPEEPGVLDREGRLVREGAEQIDHLGGEFAGCAASHDESADDPVLAQEGHGEEGAESRPHHDVANRPLIHVLRGDIGELDGLARGCRSPDRAVPEVQRVETEMLDELLFHPVGRAQVELSRCLLVLVDRAAIGVRELDGVGDDLREHRLEVQRRADRAADLPEHAQLLEGVGQLARALFDLLLEVGVRFLELPRRAVELVGEGLELVAGPDLDAVAELPCPDARRARLQGLDGLHHAAGKEQTRQHGEADAEEDQNGRPHDRGADALEGLRERLLDEDRTSRAWRRARTPSGPGDPGSRGRSPLPLPPSPRARRGRP